MHSYTQQSRTKKNTQKREAKTKVKLHVGLQISGGGVGVVQRSPRF